MAIKFQFKRGVKSRLPTLAQGEPGFTTDEGKLYVGTGSANVEMARADHGHTAAQVGARPATWTPTAAQVGARPATWTPTAAQVGARPATWTPTAGDVKTTTGTTVEAELGNRANNSYGVLTQKNLLSWAIAQTQSGPFVIDPSRTTDGVPINNSWFTGQLDVGVVHGSWSLMLKAEGAIYTNSTAAGIWGNWASYHANAPQAEFDLGLVSGFTKVIPCRYRRSWDYTVTVNIMCTFTGGLTTGRVLAELPIGYRPNTTIGATSSVIVNGQGAIGGHVTIQTDGKIVLHYYTVFNSGGTIILSPVSFPAAV